MSSNDLPSRFLAAAFGLGGLGYMMTRSEPTWEDALIGLSCLLLCAAFSVASNRRRPTRAQPVQIKQPQTFLDQRKQEVSLTGQIHPALLRSRPQFDSTPPEVPTHRQRIGDRKPQRMSRNS
ncbi:hypothetical protein ACQKQD_33115 [Methylobacterium sp. NPDC080182]|uniref:hypothetical protein n=1 Tax=Methylobacterium sp. NPDC080182 TaxID=3390590 RepID=UPI003D003D38